MLPLPQHCTLPAHEEATLPSNGCPCHGRCHCYRRHHLRHCCRLRCRCRCRCPLPLPLPSAIAIAVAIDHPHRHLCRVPVNHCRHHCPCRWPLPSPSLLAITVAISIGHHHCHRRWPFLRVVALARQDLYSNN